MGGAMCPPTTAWSKALWRESRFGAYRPFERYRAFPSSRQSATSAGGSRSRLAGRGSNLRRVSRSAVGHLWRVDLDLLLAIVGPTEPVRRPCDLSGVEQIWRCERCTLTADVETAVRSWGPTAAGSQNSICRKGPTW